MKLTAKDIQAARPRQKPVKLYDGGGLYIEVRPNGSKLWRQDYRYLRKQRRISLGSFPEVSLKDARGKSAQVRAQVAAGKDPVDEERLRVQQLSVAAIENVGPSLKEVAEAWMRAKRSSWSVPYGRRVEERLRNHVFRLKGEVLAEKVTRQELIELLVGLAVTGRVDTSRRLADYLRAMFELAEDSGQIVSNPAVRLRQALPKKQVKHMAHFDDPSRLGEYLRAIDGYQGSFETVVALRLSPLVLLRPGELRKGRWAEVDWEQEVWRKPASTMKSGRIHIVPLSRQAVLLLKSLYKLTGEGEYLFPSMTNGKRPMSENTVRAAMRRMGFGKDEITPHGFRGTASTFLHEQGWATEVIEAQLAHLDQNKTRAAYNHASYLPQRREMLQSWADYLDGLRNR